MAGLALRVLALLLAATGTAVAQPTSAPASLPTSQPSSQPAVQPTSTPAASEEPAGDDLEPIDDPDDDGWTPPTKPTGSPSEPVVGAKSVEPSTTLSARAQLRLAVDTWHEGPRPGQPGGYHEDVMELTGQALLTLDHKARDWLRLKIGGRLLYWLTTRRPEGNDSTYTLFNGELHKNELELDLLDTYAAFRVTSWLDVTAGYVTQVWGATTITSPNDVLAPQDLRFGAFLDPETARLPTPLVRTEAYFPHDLNLALYLLPVFTPHRLEMFGGDFAVLGPAAPATIQWLGELADGFLDDSMEGLAQDALISTRRPRPFSDPALATRLSWSAGGWDLALHYAWHFERQPVIRLQKSFVQALLPMFLSGVDQLSKEQRKQVIGLLATEPLPIESTYRRQHHTGVSLSGSIWELAFNFDLAYRNRTSVALGGPFPLEEDPDDNRWLVTSTDSQTVAYTVGLSYTRGEELLLTLEWWHVLQVDLMAQDNPPELLLGEPHSGGLAFLGRYRLQRPIDLTFQIMAHSDLVNQALILTPQVTYRHGDHLGVVVGVNFFEGAKESLAGRLDQNDQVFVGVEGYL